MATYVPVSAHLVHLPHQDPPNWHAAHKRGGPLAKFSPHPPPPVGAPLMGEGVYPPPPAGGRAWGRPVGSPTYPVEAFTPSLAAPISQTHPPRCSVNQMPHLSPNHHRGPQGGAGPRQAYLCSVCRTPPSRCSRWPCRVWLWLAWRRPLLPLTQTPLGERLLASPSSTYALCEGWRETVTCHPSGRWRRRDEARWRGWSPLIRTR